jgi:hypothetical protein
MHGEPALPGRAADNSVISGSKRCKPYFAPTGERCGIPEPPDKLGDDDGNGLELGREGRDVVVGGIDRSKISPRPMGWDAPRPANLEVTQ